MAFSPDGNTLASADSGRDSVVGCRTTGELKQTLQEHEYDEYLP